MRCLIGWINTQPNTTKNMASNKVFRFDDVCINSDIEHINSIVSFMIDRVHGCEIMFGISPLVHEHCGQRVYPEILNAYSDHTKFYLVDKAGVPHNLHPQAKLAGHGLIHVDHRLLSIEAQEMSIVTSCSLVNTRTFIPPFNKWNENTEQACNIHGIHLVKFEDGWRSMEYNAYNSTHDLWYLHAREWTMDKILNWFNNAVL